MSWFDVTIRAAFLSDGRQSEVWRRFSHLTCLYATTFVLPSVFTLIDTIYLKSFEKPLVINAKRPLPVESVDFDAIFIHTTIGGFLHDGTRARYQYSAFLVLR